MPEEGFESFVSAFRIPVRHGMTIGELFRLEAMRREWPPEGFAVFTLDGWRRSMMFSELGVPFVAPSPNMPSFAACVAYPGGCLFEATSWSEGRGTTRPFLLLGAPGVDGLALAELLEDEGLPGVTFVPTFFKPQFQKHSGAVCSGVELVVDDPEEFSSLRTGYAMLRHAFEAFRDTIEWRAEPYEFIRDIEAIDLLAGSQIPRRSLETGDLGAYEEWVESWDRSQSEFLAEREDVLLYK